MTLAIAIHMAQETGGFGVEPGSSGTDGSVYTPVRLMGAAPTPKRNLRLIDQGWSVGRLRKVRKRRGPDGAELTLSMPWHGYAAAATEGNSLSATLDPTDMVLASAWGAGVSIPGLGCNSLSATSFVATADDRNPGEALALYQAGQNSDRVQWRVIDAEPTNGTYTVRALLGTFTTAAFSFGFRRWRPSITPAAANGPSLAVHVELITGAQWTLYGGRPTGSLRLVLEAGEEARLEVTLTFDRMVRQDKTGRPAVTTFSPAAIMGQLSSVVWGGTEYETSQVTIEWTLGTAERKAVSGINGRSDITVRSADCKVSIAPPFGNNWEDDFTASPEAAVRRLEVSFGSGLYGAPTFNSAFFWMEAAQVVAHAANDDSNEPRLGIDIEAVDGVIPAPVSVGGNVIAPYWSLARA